MPRTFPPNSQTIAGLHANGCTFIGACKSGHPVETFKVDMAALIGELGGDTLVSEAMRRVRCPRCGAPVEVTITPARDVHGLGR